MSRLGRIIGICGFAALLSAPLTLFLWDWHLTWIAIAKLTFGLLAIGFWLATNRRGLKETFQGRSAFYGSFNALMTLTVLFALVVVNYAVTLHPRQFDLTEEGIFSLSQQTRDVLAGLDDVVEVRAFYGPKEPEFTGVLAVMERYRYASDKFVFEMIDPDVQLELVERYKINPAGPRIVLSYGEREERVKLGAREQSGPEEAITGALLKLTQTETNARICFTTGHGEKALAGDDPRQSMSLLARDLAGEGYQTAPLSLLEVEQIPTDCKVVVVAGPVQDFTPAEVDTLAGYLDSGGRLMVFVGAGDSSSLNELLNRYGVQVGRDAVFSPKGRTPLEVVTDPLRYPKTHPIFSRFFQGGRVLLSQLQAVFPMARSVARRAAPTGLTVTELVASGPDAWAEVSSFERLDEVTFEEGKDRKGPVPMAVVVEASPDAPGQPTDGRRLAVFGSSLFAVDLAYRIYPFNRNLTMNTLAWLTREEKRITIRPRFRAASLLRLSESELKFITFFSTDILPLLILALGITIWQLRRWN